MLQYSSVLEANTCVVQNDTLGALLITWVTLTFTPYTKGL